MARKPNYGFERSERTRQKAAKKATRLAAKQEKSETRSDADMDTDTDTDTETAATDTDTDTTPPPPESSPD